MRFIYLYFLLLLSSVFYSQNNARLVCGNGNRFRVYLRDKPVNKELQASVLLEKLSDDTLYVKIEFENNLRYGASIYLLEKGQPVSNREFNYRIAPAKNKISVEFLVAYDIVPLPDPLIPKEIADAGSASKTKLPDHFLELKNGKPVYFNNLPKEGSCLTAMPADFSDYARQLMDKAPGQETKYDIAEQVFRNNCLSVEQLNTLLAYISFELDRLKLIKLAYYNLVDPQNQKQLESNFKLDAVISDLKNFVEHAGEYKIKSGATCISPSPEEEITRLTGNLASFMGDAQRLDVLKKIYTHYCYSVNQVISILHKFIHDREKLEAAKLLYFNCTEKNNFMTITEVFSYSQYTNDLKDFVEKQTK